MNILKKHLQKKPILYAVIAYVVFVGTTLILTCIYSSYIGLFIKDFQQLIASIGVVLAAGIAYWGSSATARLQKENEIESIENEYPYDIVSNIYYLIFKVGIVHKMADKKEIDPFIFFENFSVISFYPVIDDLLGIMSNDKIKYYPELRQTFNKLDFIFKYFKYDLDRIDNIRKYNMDSYVKNSKSESDSVRKYLEDSRDYLGLTLKKLESSLGLLIKDLEKEKLFKVALDNYRNHDKEFRDLVSINFTNHMLTEKSKA